MHGASEIILEELQGFQQAKMEERKRRTFQEAFHKLQRQEGTSYIQGKHTDCLSIRVLQEPEGWQDQEGKSWRSCILDDDVWPLSQDAMKLSAPGNDGINGDKGNHYF